MRRVNRRPAIHPVCWRPPRLDEWRLGLDAARLLRREFPAFWAEHVAGRRATATALLGVGAAFVALASGVVELSDYAYDQLGELTRSDPVQLLADPPVVTSGGEEAWSAIGTFLARPDLMVYGLNIHTEDLDDFPALAVALTTITGHEFFDSESLAPVLGVEGEDSERWEYFEAVACMLPRISCHGDGLERLCAELNGTTCFGADLGEVLAYAHQETGNPFANQGYFEAEDARAYGVWEGTGNLDVGLAELRRLQTEARRIAAAYGHLEDLALADPDRLVDDIADAIVQAAERIGLPVRWPHDEHTETTDGNTSTDEATDSRAAAPDAETAALAAA